MHPAISLAGEAPRTNAYVPDKVAIARALAGISAALRRAEGGADRFVDFGARMIGRRVGVEIPPPKGGADAGS